MASLQVLIVGLRRAEGQLEKQLARVRSAIASLAGGTPHRGRSAGRRGPGRPKGSGRKRRKMSAKARAAISAAQKARWAKQKAGKK